MKLRTTHSLATLPISEAAFIEIVNELIAAGYGHTFIKIGGHKEVADKTYKFQITEEDFTAGRVMIDMQGIALVLEKEESESKVCFLCGKPCTEEVQGHSLHYACAVLARGEGEVVPKEELSQRDKNYYLSKENK